MEERKWISVSASLEVPTSSANHSTIPFTPTFSQSIESQVPLKKQLLKVKSIDYSQSPVKRVLIVEHRAASLDARHHPFEDKSLDEGGENQITTVTEEIGSEKPRKCSRKKRGPRRADGARVRAATSSPHPRSPLPNHLSNHLPHHLPSHSPSIQALHSLASSAAACRPTEMKKSFSDYILGCEFSNFL
ncbi:unnamed protein product, partial [Mesorhabditis belari]|uniref:Uncharacterized protein n=2 Tax=Mesorhabditis belari TaxID=2138241 RepID=A0AAF3J6D7_9BILA